MNRRDFFKTIGVASVVAALPIQLPTLAEFNVTRKIDNIYLNTGSDMWSEQRHIIPLPSTYTLELEGYSNEFLGPEAFGRDM